MTGSDNSPELQSHVALVTGAGSGIGRATALLLAGQGAAIGVLGRTPREIEDTVATVRAEGGTAMALEADISDATAMRAAVDRLVASFGRLDIVVANAGINGVWAPIDDLQPEEWDQTINVNLRGTYLTFFTTVPHLKANGGGSIIVVSSINGTRTFTTPGATAYSATKAGQLAMVQQLALELGKYRIRVNAVCPGAISTNINENTETRHADETILFLASSRSRHVTGTPIWVDGGQGLLR